MFKECKNIKVFPKNDSFIVPHICVLRIFGLKNRKSLINFLKVNKIQTGIHYELNHKLSMFKKYKKIDLPITELIYNELITLPLHPDLSEKQVIYISDKVKSYLNG